MKKHYELTDSDIIIKLQKKAKTIEDKNIIKRTRYLNKIKQIGSYSYQPIFIGNIEFKKKYSFDIYTTIEYFNSVVSKYLE